MESPSVFFFFRHGGSFPEMVGHGAMFKGSWSQVVPFAGGTRCFWLQGTYRENRTPVWGLNGC